MNSHQEGQTPCKGTALRSRGAFPFKVTCSVRRSKTEWAWFRWCFSQVLRCLLWVNFKESEKSVSCWKTGSNHFLLLLFFQNGKERRVLQNSVCWVWSQPCDGLWEARRLSRGLCLLGVSHVCWASLVWPGVHLAVLGLENPHFSEASDVETLLGIILWIRYRNLGWMPK